MSLKLLLKCLILLSKNLKIPAALIILMIIKKKIFILFKIIKMKSIQKRILVKEKNFEVYKIKKECKRLINRSWKIGKSIILKTR